MSKELFQLILNEQDHFLESLRILLPTENTDIQDLENEESIMEDLL